MINHWFFSKIIWIHTFTLTYISQYYFLIKNKYFDDDKCLPFNSPRNDNIRNRFQTTSGEFVISEGGSTPIRNLSESFHLFDLRTNTELGDKWKKSSKWFRHPWLPSVPVGGFAKLVFGDAIVHSNYMHEHRFDDRRNFGSETVDICTNSMRNCGKITVTGREWLLLGNYGRLPGKNRIISHIVAVVSSRNCFWLSNYPDEYMLRFFCE